MKIKLLFLSLIFFLVPVFSFGHGFGGWVERFEGEYILSVGYDRFDIIAGETVELDFDLFNKMRQPVEYSTVLVEIRKDDELIVATFINKMGSVFVPAILDYRFMEGGIYEFFVKFYDDGNSIVEGTLELEVESAGGWYKDRLILGGLAGFIFGAAGMFYFLRFRA